MPLFPPDHVSLQFFIMEVPGRKDARTPEKLFKHHPKTPFSNINLWKPINLIDLALSGGLYNGVEVGRYRLH